MPKKCPRSRPTTVTYDAIALRIGFTARWIDQPFSPAALDLVIPDVSHKLRLQSLRAELTTDVQGPLGLGQFFIPGSQVQHGRFELLHRCPHQPPAIVRVFHDPAIRARTPVETLARLIPITGHDLRLRVAAWSTYCTQRL